MALQAQLPIKWAVMANYILLPMTFYGYTIFVVHVIYMVQVVVVESPKVDYVSPRVEFEPVRNPKSLVSKGLRIGFC